MISNVGDREIVRQTILVPSPLQKYKPETIRRQQHAGLFLEAVENGDVDDNFVFVYGSVEVDRVIDLASQFFAAELFAVTVESETNDGLEAWLSSNQWLLYENEPQMILEPIPTVPPVENRNGRPTVVVAQDERQYQDFMNISETGSRWVPSLEAATDPEVALLVAYLDDQPVATARVHCVGNVANINGVVTQTDYQRRGIGTLMTWAAVAEGRKRGCTSVVLSASDMGYPVYRRMGFRDVCHYGIYVPPGTPI